MPASSVAHVATQNKSMEATAPHQWVYAPHRSVVKRTRPFPFRRIPNNLYAFPLTVHEREIYLYLVYRADQNGQCYPSLHTIAREVGCCKETVVKAIDGLVAKRLVIKEARTTVKGDHTSNLYTVFEPDDLAPAELPASSDVVYEMDHVVYGVDHPVVYGVDANKDHVFNYKQKTTTDRPEIRDPEAQLNASSRESPKGDKEERRTDRDSRRTEVQPLHAHLMAGLRDVGIPAKAARRLVARNAEHVATVLDWWARCPEDDPTRPAYPAGWVRAAIEQKWTEAPRWVREQARHEQRAAAAAQRQAEADQEQQAQSTERTRWQAEMTAFQTWWATVPRDRADAWRETMLAQVSDLERAVLMRFAPMLWPKLHEWCVAQGIYSSEGVNP